MPTRSETYPAPAYVAAGPNSPLSVDAGLYGRIADPDRRRLLEKMTIPVRTGAAWKVEAGHVCRFTIIEGPQVLDLNLWHRHNPRERFWAARTRQFHGAHLTTGDRLWSTLPYLRPLATVVADTLQYGLDEDHAGVHDLLGTRCDPYVNQMLAGTAYDWHCHSNLVRAVLPHGLTEFDVHDVINIFQLTGLRADDERYFMKPCPARVGDYFELFAEIDLLLAASTCPGGDLSVPLWGPDAGAEPICHPIGVEIYALDPDTLSEWTPPKPAAYRGMEGDRHGLHPSPESPPLSRATTV